MREGGEGEPAKDVGDIGHSSAKLVASLLSSGGGESCFDGGVSDPVLVTLERF